MVVTLTPNRRRFNRVTQVRIGTTSAACSYLAGASGVDSLKWNQKTPYVELPIPTAAESVWQQLVPPTVTGQLKLHDHEGVYNLLKVIDVDGVTAGTQIAILATGYRTDLSYMAVVGTHTQIVNATDGRTTVTETVNFSNPRIHDVETLWDAPGAPVTIDFTAKTFVLSFA